jgi:paraquat-inducible protein B
MLSGQLYIALDKFPDKPGFRMNREAEHGLWEIPTLPSTKREMMQSLVTSLNNLTQLDVKAISDDLQGLLTQLRNDLEKMALGEVSEGLQGTLKEARAFLADPELKEAVTNLNQTLAQLDGLAGKLNAKANPLLQDLDTDLKKLGATLDEAVATLQSVKAELGPDSTLKRELVNTLTQASYALNALRQLAQELQRNPSSIITGKKASNP